MKRITENGGTPQCEEAVVKSLKWLQKQQNRDGSWGVNIRRLRMKIEDEPSNPRHVVTVWGIGYRWDK